MDTKAIEYILELAHHQSITKTADALNISQSALSQILLRIETKVGTPLFIRQKRALTPTEAGKLYLTAARKIVDTKRKLYADIKDLSETKKIRLGLTSRWGMLMMIDILPKFNLQFPDTLIEMRQFNYSHLREEYAQYNIDIAVMAYSHLDQFPDDAELLRLEEMRLAINADHPFAIAHAEDPVLPESAIKDGLSDFGFLRSAYGSTNRALEDSLFEKINFDPVIFCESNDSLTLTNIVESNLGFAILSSDYLQDRPKIKSWPLEPNLARINTLLIRPGMQLGPAEAYLIELVHNYHLFQK